MNDTKTRYRVLLKDFMLIAEIKKQHSNQLLPGQHTLVRAVKADPWKDMLELEIIPGESR